MHQVLASTPHPSLPHMGGGVTGNFFLCIVKKALARNSPSFRRYGCAQLMENLLHQGLLQSLLGFRIKHHVDLHGHIVG